MRHHLGARRCRWLGLAFAILTACGDEVGFESTPLTCADARDNDGDGLIDCADPQCQGEVICDRSTLTPDGGVLRARYPDRGLSSQDAAAASLEAGERDGGPSDEADAGGDAELPIIGTDGPNVGLDAGEPRDAAPTPTDAGTDQALPPDPCDGRRCDEPPGPCFQREGICRAGACIYAFADDAPCDDGDPCTISDSCARGQCSGRAMTCQDAPPESCKDGSLTTFGAGRCVAGACTYESKTTPCPYGCRAGACLPKPDPCAGIRCETPPRPICRDGQTLTVYGELGKCVDGQCAYPSRDQACATPPSNFCADTQNLILYAADGLCRDNTCTYPSRLIRCPNGCASGRCLPPLTRPPIDTTPRPID